MKTPAEIVFVDPRARKPRLRPIRNPDPRLHDAILRLRFYAVPSAGKNKYTSLPWRQFKVRLLVQSDFKCSQCHANIDPDLDAYHPNFNVMLAMDEGWLIGEEKPPQFYRIFCHSCHVAAGKEAKLT